MSDILFSKMIRCGHCQSNFKSKKERGVRKYVCSRYDNGYGCQRVIISQQEVLSLLEMRYMRLLTKEEIDKVIEYIQVSENSIEIILKEDKPIKLLERFAQF